jgi:hypothetical protein
MAISASRGAAGGSRRRVTSTWPSSVSGMSADVPPQGMLAWAAPDPSSPGLATLGGHLPVMVTVTRGAWSRVITSNGWAGWVDGRTLVPFPSQATWAPTHVVPPKGTQARAAPDSAGAVVATRRGHLRVQVTEVRGAWAHVLCSNGWTGWVDDRLLLTRA